MIEIVEKLIAKSKELKDTPVIMYSREILISNLMRLVGDINAVKNNKVILLYSVKACRNKEVIKEISNFIKGFSVSSDSEYCEVRNLKSNVISATGYDFVERKDISENNIIFYFNSLQQLKFFLDKGKICSNVKIGIRMKGTPMQVPSEPIKVAVTEATKIGGLTQYAFIQITKKWAFSGRNLIATLYSEAMEAGVDFYKNFFVKKIYKRKDGYFCVESSDRTLISKFVIVATGILTFPNILDNPSKTNIGLHTPEEMTREIVNDYHWKSVLIVGTNKMSVKTLAHKINNLGEFKKIDYYVSNLSTTMLEKNYGINGVDIANYDGLLFDYNSYKLNNGSTYFLKDLDIVQENGYIVTNNFGETAVSGLFAVGSVTMPTSGVPQAIYSAQITGLYVGHLLEKTTIADYSGRFPFFPREENWKYSFQHKLEKDNK